MRGRAELLVARLTARATWEEEGARVRVDWATATEAKAARARTDATMACGLGG